MPAGARTTNQTAERRRASFFSSSLIPAVGSPPPALPRSASPAPPKVRRGAAFFPPPLPPPPSLPPLAAAAAAASRSAFFRAFFSLSRARAPSRCAPRARRAAPPRARGPRRRAARTLSAASPRPGAVLDHVLGHAGRHHHRQPAPAPPTRPECARSSTDATPEEPAAAALTRWRPRDDDGPGWGSPRKMSWPRAGSRTAAARRPRPLRRPLRP